MAPKCTNPTPYKNGIYVNITCVSPALATGWHEVIVNFEGAGETYVVNPGIEYYYELNDETAANKAIELITKYGVTNLINVITMQQMTPEVCTVMTVNTTYTITDGRDSKSYTMAKLPDGLCWLTANLRLGDTTKDLTLTPDNSDVSEDFIIPASAVQTSGTNSWVSPVDVIHIYQSGNTSYGNYYNWFAATAGTGTTSITTGDAPSSICPKGWRFPPSTGTGSYQNLFSKAGISSLSPVLAFPYNFPLNGRYISGIGYTNDASNTLSRTSYDSTRYYYANFSSSTFNPASRIDGADEYKYVGRGVRCYFAEV